MFQSDNVVVTEEELGKVLRGISIPSPPQLLADLQMELMMPSPELAVIAKMINEDVGLAGGVIKILRTPFYGLSEEDLSVTQAVLMLGMNTVLNIVNSLCLRAEICNEKLTEEMAVFMNRFWDGATDVAIAASTIAKVTGRVPPDRAYLMGLFSNAGIALMAQRYEDYPQVIKEAYTCTENRIVDTENKYYKTNHAVLGYYIAKSWHLPSLITEVIGMHHNCAQLFTDKNMSESNQLDLLAILKLAEHFSASYRIVAQQEVDCEWEQISQDILLYLNMTESEYEDLKNDLDDLGLGEHTYVI